MTRPTYALYESEERLGFFDRRECIAMNLSFAHAMLAARDRGEEQFTLGPVVDRSPIYPQHFPTQPQRSLMSSSAAQCLDTAWDGQAPTRLTPLPGKPTWGGHR